MESCVGGCMTDAERCGCVEMETQERTGSFFQLFDFFLHLPPPPNLVTGNNIPFGTSPQKWKEGCYRQALVYLD